MKTDSAFGSNVKHDVSGNVIRADIYESVSDLTTQKYPETDSLEVHDLNQNTRYSYPQDDAQISTKQLMAISPKRAVLIATIITGIVLVITVFSSILLGRNSISDQNRHQAPSQQIDIKVTNNESTPPELTGAQESLLVSGDIITKGNFKVSSKGYITILSPDNLTADQAYTLPDSSGVFCLSSNNCSYGGLAELTKAQADIAGLQNSLGQIVIPSAQTFPAVPPSSLINNQRGAVSIQGTSNQISVTTGSGVITLATPQDLATVSSPGFASLFLSGNLTVNGNLTLPLNCSTSANGGTLTTTAGGQVICADDDGGAGAAINGSGTVGTLAVFTAAQTIASLTGPSDGQILLGNGTTPTFTTIGGDATVSGAGTVTIQANAVALGVDTTGNYVADITAGNGISVTGGAAEGSTPTVSVVYGSAANTAVQGNTVLTCPAGSGNLTGGGNNVTLGAGGSCGALSVVGSPMFSGTLAVQGATITIGTAAQQGTLILNDGSSNTGSLAVSALGQDTLYTLPDAGGGTATICLSTGNCLGGGAGGANTALSNLTSVAINTSLLSGSATIDLGSQTNPFRDLYLGGTGTNNFRITGTATVPRTITIPDATGDICLSSGNCAGVGGTGDIVGNGTSGTIARFSGTKSIVDSIITELGNTITVTGTLNATTALQTAGTTRITSGGVLQNVSNADASNFFTGGALSVARGGTGTGSTPTNGQLLIGNGTGYTLATLASGDSTVTITNGSGTIDLSVPLAGTCAACVALQGATPGIAQTGHINITGTIIAGFFSGNGTSLNNLAAGAITTGTLNDTRLSGNVSLLGQTIGLAELEADSVNGSKVVDGSIGNIDLTNPGLSVSAGGGLINGGLVNLGASVTLNIGAGDGITVNADDVAVDATVCRTTGNCLGGPGGGASVSLSNLASVAINTSLLSGSATIDLGSNTNPFRDLYVGGTATNNIRITGTSAGARVYTLPDVGSAADFCLSTGNCVGGAGGAPNSAAYLTIGNNATLTGERAITAGTNLSAVDGGADGAYTLNVVNNPTFSGLITAQAGISVTAGQTLTVNGDAFTDLTGTGLTITGGALQASLGTSVDLTTEVTGTLPVTGGGTGQTSYTDGQLLIGNSVGNTLSKATLTAGVGVNIVNGNGTITISSPGSGTCAACANTSLSNLASVAINTSLLSGSAIIDLGSNTNPFRDLYVGGTATNNIRITGTSAGARVYTLPDVGSAADFCLSTGNCVGGAGGAPNSAAYLTIGNNATLTGERAITAGTNLSAVDGGADGAYTLNVVNNPTFSGLITAQAGISVTAGQTLTVNGDAFTDLTGTGLTITGGALQASLGTSVDLTTEVTGTLPVTGGGTGQTSYTDGQLLIGNSVGNTLSKATLTAGVGVNIVNGNGTITISSPGSGTCAACANTSLSNLASVAINTSLLSGSAIIDLGSNTNPFRDLYVGGTATNNIRITGTSAGARVYTLPDVGSAADFCLSTGNCVGGAGGAPNSAAYLTIGNNATLTGERAITAGTNLSAVDGGADGAYTLNVVNNPTFSGLITAQAGISVTAGQTLTVNGDAFTDLTGTGLTITGNALASTLGTSVDLNSAEVTNTLQLGNGGTGATTSQAAINNISQLTTEGDLLFRNATNSTRLARGTNGQCLTSNATTVVWGTCQPGGSGVTTIGALDGGTANANGATISGVNLFLQSADASFAGLVNTGTQTFAGAKTFTGNAILQGDTTIGDAGTDLLTISATIQGANPLVFEGATADGFETTLAIADPTADVTYRFASTTTGTYDICTTTGNCVGAGGGTAPNNGEYITYSANATLSAERVLTGGSNISAIDLGTPGQAIINVASAPTFTGLLSANGGLTVEAGDTFTVNGDAFTDLTGTGLTITGNALASTLGTSVDLNSAEVTNTLQLGNGGTGATTSQAAINNISQLTTEGDLLFRNATNSTRLARGTNGQCLTSNATTVVWGTCQPGGSGVTTIGALDGGTANANGATISGVNLFLQSADASFAGLVNTGTQTFAGAKTFTGNAILQGDTTIGDAGTDLLTISATIQGANPLVFEGATADGFETTLAIADPTADVTYRFASTTTGTYDICTTTGNCVGAGGGTAPNNGEYITYSANATLSAERVLTGGSNISAIDLGTPGQAIINVASAPTFTGLLSANGGLTVEAGDTFTVNGDAFTDLTGTGLTITGNALASTLGTSVDLNSAEVTNTLQLGNGGTGATTSQAAINNISQLTTEGDLLFRNATNSTRLARGTNGQCLTSNATTVVWGTCQPGGSGVTTIGALDGGTANANGATISGVNLFLQSADASFAGLVNTGTQTFAGAKTFTGNAILQGDTTIGDAGTDLLTISATIQGANPLVFEGATADGFETTLAIADPTADVTYRFASTTTGTYDICTTTGNCVGAGGGTAPNNGEYITYSANATLSAERVLTGGSNISAIDLGTPGQAIINVASAPTFTGLLSANGGLTVEAGDTFTVNGDAFTDLTGTGLTITGNALASTLGTSVDLNSAEVTNTLQLGNGGTGATTSQAAINNISQLTTEGDLLFRNATNSTRLARGTNGQCLTSNATTVVWGTCQPGGSGVTTIGALDGGTANANGATISGVNLFLQSADASFAGLVNTGTQTFAGAKTFTGNAILQGDTTIGDAGTDLLTISATIQGANPLVFEGATADGFETTLAIADPTADVTYRFASTTTGTYDICTTTGNCVGAGGGTAPNNGEYITYSANATLSAERVLTGGSNISAIDLGTPGQAIINVASAPTFTGLLSANGGLTVEAGDTFTVNGDAFTDLTGTGLTITGNALASTLGTSVDLNSAEVTNTLQLGNGGTGATTSQAAINNISQLTTEGDLLFRNATNSTRLARGTNGQCLTSNATTVVWGTCQPGGSGVTTIGALDGGTANANGATISGVNLFLQSADASFAGLVNTGTQTFAGAKTFTGNAILQGDTTIGDAGTDLLTISATIQGANPLVFEGATADGFETTLAIADPTADVTYRFASTTTGTYDICTTTGNCVGAGGGTAPNNGEYITYSANATLSAERVLTGGSNISAIDLGTPGQAIINVASAPTFTGLLSANGGLTVEAGDTFTVNGDAFTDLTGTGLTITGNALASTLGTSVDLNSAEVTNTLQLGNGGTGATTSQAAINNISQLTTEGDLLFRNATNSTRLARGTNGQCLTSNATTVVWGTCQPGGSGVTTIGALDGGTANANGATISGVNLFLQSADASFAGLVNTGTQTFAGAKTFTGLLTGQAGATVSGAAINLNASSNFDTNINTGTSTGTVSIGNASNANNTVTLQAGATGGINLNSASVNSNAATLALFASPTSITLGAAAATFNIGPAGASAATIAIAGGSGATGCTVDGATGNLVCTGTITSTAGTAAVGYFTRSGTTLQPATAGDSIQTSGNLATTGTGTITAAGILNASATGKTAITVADSGAQNSGITIGGDTNLYRSAADTLRTDDNFKIQTLTNSTTAFQIQNANASSNLFTADTVNSRIGIGTATPTKLLDIAYGNLNFTTVPAPGALTATVSATAGNLNGTYKYWVTYVTEDGETNLGTASATVSPASKQVNLTNIPVSGLSRVTARKIYRTDGVINYNAYFLTTLSDNTTTVYTDNIADGSLPPTLYQIRGNTTSGRLFVDNDQVFYSEPTTISLGVGRGALGVNLGRHNVAVGPNALGQNTTGEFNSAVGSGALYGTTTGYYNNAFGYQSLQNNTVGYENSAYGYGSMINNVSGFQNTAIGNYTLVNTTGSKNTALGYKAGETSVGANANTTGTGNTFVGHNSGPGVVSASSLQNATAIGINSVVSQNDSLILGCINGLNGCTATTKIGIADAVPSTLLSLGGTGVANGITLGDDAAQSVNLYQAGSNLLQTDDDFIVGGDDFYLGSTSGIRLSRENNDELRLYTSAGEQLRINATNIYALNNNILANNAGTGFAKVAVATDDTNKVGVAIRGEAGQTADLLQVQNSAGTVLGGFSALGRLGVGTAPNSSPSNDGILLGGSSDYSRITNLGYGTSIDFGYVPATGMAAGDMSLIAGNVGTSMSVGVSLNYTGASFKVIQNAASATTPVTIIKGGATPGGGSDLLQFQNSAGTILTAFQTDGKLVFGPSGNQDTNLYRSNSNILKTDDSLTVAGGLTVSSLANCTSVQTNANGDFSCGSPALPDTAAFVDSTSDTLNDSSQSLWDGTQPNITPTASSQTVLVSVSIKIDSAGTDDEVNRFQIYRSTTGSDATCSSTAVGGTFGARTTDNANQFDNATVTFLDSPGVASQVRYTVCESTESTAAGAVNNTTPQIDFSLVALGADLAENYYTTDNSLSAGHVVSLDTGLPAGVKKSGSAYDQAIGVVSTTPGYVLDDRIGEGFGRPVPIALAGRVPVKVSDEGGAIRAGDYLVASSTPGVAMKATQPGRIIGTAMSDFSGSGEGQVMIFVHTGYADPNSNAGINDIQGNSTISGNLDVLGIATFESLNVSGHTTLESLSVTGNVSVGGNLTVAGDTSFKGNIIVEGHIVSAGNAPVAMVLGDNSAGAVITIEGNDTAGTITIKTSTGSIISGELAKVIFNKPFSSAPRIILSGQDAKTLDAKIFPSQKTADKFVLKTAEVLPANTIITLDYFILE